MKAKTGLLLAAWFIAHCSSAQTVDTADLGLLELEYASVTQAARYPGQAVAAMAGYRAGDGISIVTTPRVQQVDYLLAPGARVARGQAIARLSGPEVHHFFTEFEVISQRLAVAEKRFQANRDLYSRQAIDEGRWIDISDAYYALKLEHEHLRHFHELLEPGAEGGDGAILEAPAAGILEYGQPAAGIPRGGELARIIPEGSLRLRLAVPLARRNELSALRTESCELGIAEISGIADQFRVTVWSAALTEQCDYLPGQRVMMTPWYRGAGYRIPARALMQWQGQPAVLVREAGLLAPRTVELLGSSGDAYFVRCDEDLADREVLTTSVSAVQGILLGLGGE